MPTDRQSLNRAFWELGLRFQWDEAVWSTLLAFPDLRAQLAYYVERHQPHLLSAYDIDFLKCLVEQRLATPGDSRVGMEAHGSF
jgi:hypothetical protein